MKILKRIRSSGVVVAHDLLMVPVAWLGAYWLRFNLGTVPEPLLRTGLVLLPLVMIVQGVAFSYFGLYRGVWRFASIPDLVRIVKAALVGVSTIAIAVFLLTRMANVPRSVLPLYGLLLVVAVGAPRLLYRWVKDHRLYTTAGSRVLIIGAGRAGETLARDLLRDPKAGFEPVCFVDDDRRKRGNEIHGVRVRGRIKEIPRIVEERDIDLIMIALPSASSRQMRRVVEICESAGVPFRTLPQMHDLVSGRVTLKELREVSIEDLLGREPVTLAWDAISNGVRGRTILVTGGGGSIGSELCRQIANRGPKALIVFENSEFNLFRIEQELRARFPDLSLRACLGDVCDNVAVRHVVETHRPNVVFHAAAYKHVPMLQEQAREAVSNNVLGTRNVARAAMECGSDGFVLISTDKAVHPGNVMGASKRVAEILCQNLDRLSSTRFITVRFGNVLGSAGSVVPIFREQIAAGGPVTVTHREVKRYFMTIPEASQLIMEASVLGQGGEIFVLDMGEPIKIRYLAEQMILLSGRKPETDIEIVYTGLRPGEKMFEELFHEEEPLSATGHDKILLAQHRVVDRDLLDGTLERMAETCALYDEETLKVLLAKLVPEYKESAVVAGTENTVQLDEVKA